MLNFNKHAPNLILKKEKPLKDEIIKKRRLNSLNETEPLPEDYLSDKDFKVARAKWLEGKYLKKKAKN